MKAARGRVIVKPVETEDTYNGGSIVLPQSVREGMAQYQCEVLSVGLPDICEDKKCQRPHDRYVISDFGGLNGEPPRISAEQKEHRIPPPLVVGSWVLVRPRSFIDLAHPTERRYAVRISDIEAVFRVTA